MFQIVSFNSDLPLVLSGSSAISSIHEPPSQSSSALRQVSHIPTQRRLLTKSYTVWFTHFVKVIFTSFTLSSASSVVVDHLTFWDRLETQVSAVWINQSLSLSISQEMNFESDWYTYRYHPFVLESRWSGERTSGSGGSSETQRVGRRSPRTILELPSYSHSEIWARASFDQLFSCVLRSSSSNFHHV